jgi:hypothetical protein
MGYLPFGLVVGLKTRPLLFLHDMKQTYSDKLKSPKWQKKRLEILSRDKFTCKLCKDTETQLHVHHKYYEDGCDPWEYPNTALVTLCAHCHQEIERFDKHEHEFHEFKVIKHDNWTTGGRIMWIQHGNTVTMRIYDENDEFVRGYNITSHLKEISYLFKKANSFEYGE